MAITKFTFFSPNGNDFPVTATADAKLYSMIGGIGYDSYRMKHWSTPTNTALNRVYVNTSIILGGRYFELINETVTLTANATNYVHVNIDLTNTASPVSITVEMANNSNSVDINNTSGVLKHCIETVITSATAVTSSTIMPMTQTFKNIVADSIKSTNDTDGWVDLTPINGFSGNLKYRIKNGVLSVRAYALTGPAVAQDTAVIMANLPNGIDASYLIGVMGTAPAIGSGLFASYPCMVYSNTNGNIYFARDAALPAGYKISGTVSVPI
ncbi:hypothetical protein [Lactococcus fujiensis]|uniref:Receptor-binding protein N-terminal shoulder domain-containing protein n=1 Tax=Lactococcus fujiensis JCM 16395 TaxID=1291764 RepID=A0A2A5RIE1_9LACT|nr:hypothetical protein [Lactococcus fujiensis]PCR98855.1 hypothetical protein RT41_GL000639 [Lactococcus fujiensis JCM 16395]